MVSNELDWLRIKEAERVMADLGYNAKASDAATWGREMCLQLAKLIRDNWRPPVDPMLREAREIGVSFSAGTAEAADFRNGRRDDTDYMAALLMALRRGVEIGSGK